MYSQSRVICEAAAGNNVLGFRPIRGSWRLEQVLGRRKRQCDRTLDDADSIADGSSALRWESTNRHCQPEDVDADGSSPPAVGPGNEGPTPVTDRDCR